MKEYKVVKVKCKTKYMFCADLETAIEESLNKYARNGWTFEQFSIQDEASYAIVIFSKPKMM